MLQWCQHRPARLRASRVHGAGVRTSPPRSRREGEAEQYQAPRPRLSFATISGAHHGPSHPMQSWCDRGVRRHAGTGPGHHSYIGGGMNNMPREAGAPYGLPAVSVGDSASTRNLGPLGPGGFKPTRSGARGGVRWRPFGFIVGGDS